MPDSAKLKVAVDELGELVGLAPDAVSAARHRRRAQQLVQYLMSSESADRAHAVAELSSGGPVAAAAVPALTELLKGDDFGVSTSAQLVLQAVVPRLTKSDE